MPSVFIWPPEVRATNPNSSSFGFFYSDKNHIAYNSLQYSPTREGYLLGVQDYYSAENRMYWQSWARSSDAQILNGTAYGNRDTTHTASNGQTVLNGQEHVNQDVVHRIGTDFGGNAISWASVASSPGTNYRGFLTISGLITVTWATPFFVPFNAAAAVAQGTASDYYCFYKDTEGGFDSIFYTRCNNGTFTTGAALISPGVSAERKAHYLLDAGEGYYYLVYGEGGNLGIRGVNLSGGGTPSVTGLLGGSGVAGWSNTVKKMVTQRYVTLGSNRLLIVQTATEFITITFTSGTKATPTIVKTSRSCSQTHVSLEYDPDGAGNAYVVAYRAAGAYPCNVFAAYAPLSPPSTAFSAETQLASIYNSREPNFLREYSFGCAQAAHTINNVFAAGVSITFGYAYSLGLAFTCWHEPVVHELGVAVGRGNSSVAIDKEVSRGRRVDVRSSYSRVEAGVAFSAAVADDFQWIIDDSEEYVVGVEVGRGYSSVTVDAIVEESTGPVIHEIEVIVGRGYSSVAVGAIVDAGEIILEALPLTQQWLSVGYDYMDEFMVYVNADRAAVGLPPYKTFGKDSQFLGSKDAANYQATQMAWFGTLSHNNPLYPPLKESISLRADYIPSNTAAENILAQPWYHLPSGTDFGFPTPMQLWQLWHDSPTHYATMTRNWGPEYNDKVYSFFSIADGPAPVEFPAAAGFRTIYGCNVFAVLETSMFEINLQEFWSNGGALISSLDQQWSIDTWTRVRSSHELRYAARIAVQHQSDWGCRVAAQHTVPMSYSLVAQHEAPYTQTEIRVKAQNESLYAVRGTIDVRAQHTTTWSSTVSATLESPYAVRGLVASSSEASYAISDRQPVTTQHEAGYGLRVSASHESEYSVRLGLQTSAEFGYAIKDRQPVAGQHESTYALRVSASHETQYSYNTTVRAQHESGFAYILHLAAQHSTDYSILPSNPVRQQSVSYYAMQDYTSMMVTNNVVTVSLPDGSQFRVDDAVIDSQAGDVGYSFEFGLADFAVFSRIEQDTPIVVNFCGEEYNFVIRGKTVTRDSPSSVVMRVQADNAVVRTGPPYALASDFNQLTESSTLNLVNEFFEIDFTYEIVNWDLPAGRLQAAGATPLEAVTQIAEAVGAVVDGHPDGTARLRYPYPEPTDALDSASVDQEYSDAYDTLSASTETIYRSGFDRFRIREGDASYSDILEWVRDEDQPNNNVETGIVKAYLSPYRTTAQIVHRGNAISAVPLPEAIETFEELVEFRAGTGNVAKPIHQLLSVEWYTASLGSPVFDPYSTALTVGTAIAEGHGLAKVTYNAKHLRTRVVGAATSVSSGSVGPASVYAYFTLEESNA